jgi:hypothetical protein
MIMGKPFLTFFTLVLLIRISSFVLSNPASCQPGAPGNCYTSGTQCDWTSFGWQYGSFVLSPPYSSENFLFFATTPTSTKHNASLVSNVTCATSSKTCLYFRYWSSSKEHEYELRVLRKELKTDVEKTLWNASSEMQVFKRVNVSVEPSNTDFTLTFKVYIMPSKVTDSVRINEIIYLRHPCDQMQIETTTVGSFKRPETTTSSTLSNTTTNKDVQTTPLTARSNSDSSSTEFDKSEKDTSIVIAAAVSASIIVIVVIVIIVVLCKRWGSKCKQSARNNLAAEALSSISDRLSSQNLYYNTGFNHGDLDNANEVTNENQSMESDQQDLYVNDNSASIYHIPGDVPSASNQIHLQLKPATKTHHNAKGMHNQQSGSPKSTTNTPAPTNYSVVAKHKRIMIGPEAKTENSDTSIRSEKALAQEGAYCLAKPTHTDSTDGRGAEADFSAEKRKAPGGINIGGGGGGGGGTGGGVYHVLEPGTEYNTARYELASQPPSSTTELSDMYNALDFVYPGQRQGVQVSTTGGEDGGGGVYNHLKQEGEDAYSHVTREGRGHASTIMNILIFKTR